jgi:transposase-like protein
METGSFLRSGGELEADETYVGGKAANMHTGCKRTTIQGGRGTAGKEVVMGILRRGTDMEHSKVTAQHVPDNTMGTVQAGVRAAAEPRSKVYTDALRSYNGLASDYVHQVVDHAVEYVRDQVHTNGLENFWSLFKRALKGTYVSVEPGHLDVYVVEQTFRFNERKDNDGGRFRRVLASVSGKRLTYKELTGHGAASAPA